MDDKLIYCFDEKYKKDLIAHGYTFVQDSIIGNRKVAMFLNDGCKLDFNLENKLIMFSDKMYF